MQVCKPVKLFGSYKLSLGKLITKPSRYYKESFEGLALGGVVF